MNDRDLKFFEKLLFQQRERLLREIGAIGGNGDKSPRDSSGDLSAYSFHMADQASDAMEQDKKFYFASKGGRLLYHVDEALVRIGKGEYGLCRACREEIARERLEAVPHARLCIACKEKEERGEPLEIEG